MNASEFIAILGEKRSELTRQQVLTLRGQALSGDAEGAKRGLEKILRRKHGENRQTKNGV